MNNTKIIELKLIENKKKTKRNLNYDLSSLKDELYDILDCLIEYNFSNIDSNISIDYIKEQLPVFIKLYINLNRNIKNISGNNTIVTNIVNELINDVIYRCEKIKNEDIIKFITDAKKDKLSINTVSLEK